MKKATLLLLALSFFAFTGCDKDEDPNPGEVTLRVSFVSNGAPVAINDVLPYNGNDHKISLVKMYLSNLALQCSCGSIENLAEVVLVDSDQDQYSFTFEVDPGTYTGLQMSLGLPSELNGQDPSIFAADHPMSAQQNMYWTWASKYRFLIYEGKVDSTQSDNFDHFLVYHTGLDTLYRDMGTFPLSLTVEGDSKQTIDVTFDLLNVLYNVEDPIDVFMDDDTHTMDHLDLAKRITDNAVASFNIE